MSEHQAICLAAIIAKAHKGGTLKSHLTTGYVPTTVNALIQGGYLKIYKMQRLEHVTITGKALSFMLQQDAIFDELWASGD